MKKIPEQTFKVNCFDCGAYIREHTGFCMPTGQRCDQCIRDAARDQQADKEYGHRVNGYAKAWC